MKLGRLHHLGIVVDDPDSAACRAEEVFGIPITLLDESTYTCRVDGVEQSTVQRLGISVEGPPHLELLRTVPGSDVWHRSHGVHHLGFVVDDLAEASRELERRGAPLWVGGLRDGSCPSGTAYHHGPFGITIELLDTTTRNALAARANAAQPELPKP